MPGYGTRCNLLGHLESPLQQHIASRRYLLPPPSRFHRSRKSPAARGACPALALSAPLYLLQTPPWLELTVRCSVEPDRPRNEKKTSTLSSRARHERIGRSESISASPSNPSRWPASITPAPATAPTDSRCRAWAPTDS